MRRETFIRNLQTMGNRKAAADMYNAAVKAVADKTQASYLTHAYHLFSSA